MLINADNEKIVRMGRFEYTDRNSVKMFHAGTQLFVKFVGTSLSVQLINVTSWGDVKLGYVIDGVVKSYPLDNQNDNYKEVSLHLCEGLENTEHTLILYKKHAGNNYHEVISFETDGEFLTADSLPELKVEVYGDSVCAGEVIHAYDYTEKQDPEGHNSKYDDVWNSFVMQTARNLNAQIHNICQGGIALFNGTGYFHAPEYIGLESTYDKISYVPSLSEPSHWDFGNYTPDIVIIAIGQNDKHNGFTDSDDLDIYDNAYRELWKNGYKKFINELNVRYNNPVFILTTTILMHDAEWDNAIEEIKNEMSEQGVKVYHNLFTRNGSATPGHPRLSEHNEMAGELTAFIKSVL